ncbi:efflux RND transporter periplasmic adaptor subunit [Niveispirillum irakense]|uniref:efflux RND transporter periplasmic adaptor subunit n=1 Tax=Niveispirillum irakense TaxID=34011 RepID=UPI000409171B|nr:HlyD family efflux transporter periplasmic adaptor subunit [Niveispirillum irakense]
MSYLSAAARPGLALAGLALAATLALTSPSLAGPGHDHGAPAAATPAPAHPSLEATGGDVELVATLRDGTLVVYVDRLLNNVPVTDAAVTLSVGGGNPQPMQAASDGTYTIEAPWATAGEHALTFTVTGDTVADLLIGTLDVHDEAEAGPTEDGHGHVSDIALPLAALLVGLAGGWLLARRRPGGPAVIALALALCLPLIPQGGARAHEGHDEAPAPASGDAPRRLPDGSLFVPKPTQRLLQVRTMMLEVGAVSPTHTLPGRVIADPNRSGRVQAPQSGRIMPPEDGFPRLGDKVAAGQVLGYVELSLQATDRGSVAEQLAGLEKEISLARQDVARLEQLVGAVTQKSIDDARTTLAGLQRQRTALERALVSRIPLTAPVDGIVAASNAVAGLMVEDRDVTILFEIVDPQSLMVEALAFEGGFASGPLQPAMIRVEGQDVTLAPVGRGPARQGGAIPLLFRPEGALPVVAGDIVTVAVPMAVGREGLLVPREAVVRGSDGLPTLFVHQAPQQFIPHAVRVAPAGPTHVQILDGVGAGERVVVQGAELLNQIR